MTATRRSSVVSIPRSLVVCLSILRTIAMEQPAPAQTQDGASQRRPTLDVASLAAEVRYVQAQIKDGRSTNVLSSLPPAWEVAAPDGRYSISTEPLSALLQGEDKAPSREDLNEAALWLERVAQHFEGFSKASLSPAWNARTRLDNILARPEFGRGGRSSAIEALRQRVAAWVADLIRRIFGGLAQYPAGKTVLFWVLAAVGLTILALWLFRFRHPNRGTLDLQAPQQPAVPRSWEQWILDARRAADHDDPREAIRCAYWAAVMRLQETKILPKDLNQTPREYLRFVSEPSQTSSDQRARSMKPLAGLTIALESFWYAGRPASLDDFRESLNHLEALGCKLD